MEQLFSSGRIADVILALMLAEGIALTLVRRVTGRGPRPRTLWINLLAGAALVLALRSALASSGWHVTAGWLVAGLAAHLADVCTRWET